MSIKNATSNYLDDYCTNFVNENVSKPIIEFGEEQLKEFLQGYLAEIGYSRDRAEAILSITTSSVKIDLDKYLNGYKNNSFAAKLADLEIFNKLDIATDIYEKGGNIYSFISNGVDMSSYSAEEMQSSEYKDLLKSQLGVFLDLTCDLMEYIPGGEMYSSTIPEIKKAIDETIENGLNHNAKFETAKILYDIGKAWDINFNEWSYGCAASSREEREKHWVNGPMLEELSAIYNSSYKNTHYFDGYLEWRLAYELNEKIRDTFDDAFGELDVTEKTAIDNFEDYYSETHIELIEGTIGSIGVNIPEISSIGDEIIGTSGPDSLSADRTDIKPTVIYGKDGNDTIYGYEADDILLGDNGDDYLYGNYGNDILYGGSGDDVLLGQYGKDTLFGGNGNDSLYGHEDDDFLVGEDGDDRIYGGNGNDTIGGRDGDDILCGDGGDDSISGGAGNDSLYGGMGNNVIGGGAGTDMLYGGTDNDIYIFNLGDGNDTIKELSGNSALDTVKFGSGITPNDVVVTRDGHDMVLKIGGSDTLRIAGQYYYKTHQVESFEFSDGTVISAEDYFNTSLTIEGEGAVSDFTNGFGTRDTTLIGSSGDDNIHGYAGNDILIGGKGNDTLWGDADNDTYIFSLGDGNDTIKELSGNSALDTVKFGSGITPNDVVVTRDGHDMVFKIGGSDTLRIVGQYYYNTHQVESFEFSDGTVISAEDYFNTSLTIEGEGAVSDFTNGFGTRDTTLIGSSGDDNIYGYAGNDILIGGKGNDTLWGYTDNDTYIFSLGDGNDTIKEMNGNSDSDIVKFGDGISAENIYAVKSGNNIILEILGTDDSLTIINQVSNTMCRVENFELSDGRAADYAQINQLVQSMVSFETETGMLWSDAIEQKNETAMSIVENIWTQKETVY